jgi:hypothetical protein
MKHVYPVRHPASLDAAEQGAATASQGSAGKPALPHEQDEASHSQASTTPQQKDVGRKAYDNATDGTTDTDKGPAMDQVYNDKVAPDRGQSQPRQ